MNVLFVGKHRQRRQESVDAYLSDTASITRLSTASAWLAVKPSCWSILEYRLVFRCPGALPWVLVTSGRGIWGGVGNEEVGETGVGTGKTSGVVEDVVEEVERARMGMCVYEGIEIVFLGRSCQERE